MKLKEVEPRENRLKPDAQSRRAGQDLMQACYSAQNAGFHPNVLPCPKSRMLHAEGCQVGRFGWRVVTGFGIPDCTAVFLAARCSRHRVVHVRGGNGACAAVCWLFWTHGVVLEQERCSRVLVYLGLGLSVVSFCCLGLCCLCWQKYCTGRLPTRTSLAVGRLCSNVPISARLMSTLTLRTVS